MRRALVYLFGSGWWILWHGLLWIWLLPIAFVAWWFATVFERGAGPQGGEAIFAFLLLAFLGLAAMTGVNAFLLGAAVEGPWWLRYVALPIAAPVAAAVIALAVAVTIDLATTRTAAGVLFAVADLGLLALLVVLNLHAIDRFRRRR